MVSDVETIPIMYDVRFECWDTAFVNPTEYEPVKIEEFLGGLAPQTEKATI